MIYQNENLAEPGARAQRSQSSRQLLRTCRADRDRGSPVTLGISRWFVVITMSIESPVENEMNRIGLCAFLEVRNLSRTAAKGAEAATAKKKIGIFGDRR